MRGTDGVTANIVDDPAGYPHSGHRELIRKTTEPLTDVEQTLGIYGDTLGVERWHQSPRELGRALGRRADVVSRWVRWGARRRQEESDFGDAYDELDRRLSEMVGE